MAELDARYDDSNYRDFPEGVPYSTENGTYVNSTCVVDDRCLSHGKDSDTVKTSNQIK